MMMKFRKVAKVETFVDTEGNEYFFYNGKHFLNEFMRCHDNPWIQDVYPEWLDGVETENYYDPLAIRYDTRSDRIFVYESEVA